jgi:hypothetical protein
MSSTMAAMAAPARMPQEKQFPQPKALMKEAISTQSACNQEEQFPQPKAP